MTAENDQPPAVSEPNPDAERAIARRYTEDLDRFSENRARIDNIRARAAKSAMRFLGSDNEPPAPTPAIPPRHRVAYVRTVTLENNAALSDPVELIIDDSDDELTDLLPAWMEALGPYVAPDRLCPGVNPKRDVRVGPTPPIKGEPLNAGFPPEHEGDFMVAARISPRSS